MDVADGMSDAVARCGLAWVTGTVAAALAALITAVLSVDDAGLTDASAVVAPAATAGVVLALRFREELDFCWNAMHLTASPCAALITRVGESPTRRSYTIMSPSTVPTATVTPSFIKESAVRGLVAPQSIDLITLKETREDAVSQRG